MGVAVAGSTSAWPQSAVISAARSLSLFVVNSLSIFSLILTILLVLAASRIAISLLAIWIHEAEIKMDHAIMIIL